ncbi:MAG TPA: rhomboid family intramembrane serine protease [Ignavibacteriaceae bacterium]|nr:rhomboid family intramembrane serine protease [Ignavibacteriaceae bacterium]
MLPIGDDNRDRTTTPYINYLIIIANILVFLLLQDFGTNEIFTYAFSLVPEEITTGEDIVTDDRLLVDPITGQQLQVTGLQPTPFSVYFTFISSMFMHGSLAHIFGNMLFLFIFGDNIEHRLGHFRYLIFYLLSGILATVAHIIVTYSFDGNPLIPTLGASGAISGILGAYLILYPTRRVSVILFYFVTHVPAIIAIGLWFVFQIINGIGVLGTQEGGVAYGAHIGGFIAGMLMIGLFIIGRKKSRLSF